MKKEASKELMKAEVVDGVNVLMVKNTLDAINAFQGLVRSQLKEKHDYGTIPGTNKPTLLKPGAEKIAKLLKCADTYEIVKEIEDWDRPLFSYTIKCRLVSIVTDKVISEGIGECNSWEEKYRYRWVGKRDVPQGINPETLPMKWRRFGSKSFPVYRLDNDNIFSIKNTILKMAKKRALVDAALSAGRLSDLFTQDIEEFKFDSVMGDEIIEEQKEEKLKKASQEVPQEVPQETPREELNNEEGIKRDTIINFVNKLEWNMAKLESICAKNFKKKYGELTIKELDKLMAALAKKLEEEV